MAKVVFGIALGKWMLTGLHSPLAEHRYWPMVLGVLVIALPVGFVHVVESKEELMSLGIPYIATVGRRGGSPLAVSIIHALCGLAVAERR